MVTLLMSKHSAKFYGAHWHLSRHRFFIGLKIDAVLALSSEKEFISLENSTILLGRKWIIPLITG